MKSRMTEYLSELTIAQVGVAVAHLTLRCLSDLSFLCLGTVIVFVGIEWTAAIFFFATHGAA